VEESAEGSEEGQAGPTRRLTGRRAGAALAALDRHSLAVELAAATLVALWLTRNFWLPGRYVVGFDTVAYSGPNMEVTLDAWRAGRLPLWNELIFGGVTHLGNPQAGSLYPAKVLGLLLDTNRAMGVLVAVHVVLLGTGTVLFVRRLRCRAPAGFTAAFVLTASGAVLTRAVQFEQILVLAWAPLLLLAITTVVDSPRRSWGAMAGTAVVVAMVLLAGHPQIAYQLVVVAAVWTVALVAVVLRQRRSLRHPSGLTQSAGHGGDLVGPLVLRQRRSLRHPSGLTQSSETEVRAPKWSWRRLLDLAAAVGAGVAVAAPQLVAAGAATRDSEIGIGRSLTELESPALATRPGYLAQVLFGTVRHLEQDVFAGGFESIGYVGVAGAFLAVVGLVVACRDRARRPLGIAVAGLAVVGVVWALGPRTPVFTAAYDWLPGFDLARASARWLDVTALCVAIGAGWAVDAIRRRIDLRVPVAIGAALLLAALLLGAFDVVLTPGRRVVFAWVVAGVVVVVALTVLAARRPTLAVTAVVVVAAVELIGTTSVSPIDVLTSSTPFDDLPAGPAGELRGLDGLSVALTDDAFGDPAYLVAGFRPNTNVLAEVRSLDGYDGGVQITKRFAALGESLGSDADPALPLRNKLPAPLDPELAASLGVRWAVLDNGRDAIAQLPGWQPTELRDETFTVWENPAWIGDAVLTPASAGDAAAVPSSQPSPERIVVDVTGVADTAGHLVVHRQTAAGWHVDVDGQDVPLREEGGFFLAVDVPSGAEQVTFTYRPRWVTPTLVVSTIGALTVVLMSLMWLIRGDILKRRH
jgi:hypothetical protein